MSIPTPISIAKNIFRYVKDNPNLALNNQEEDIPDIWTFDTKHTPISTLMDTGGYGIFTEVFDRTNIIPTRWVNFSRQFYTPEAKLLIALEHACENSSWLTWTPELMRDDFVLNGHWFTKKQQHATYAHIIKLLRQGQCNNIQIVPPTKSYRDAPNAFGVQLNDDVVVDFPSDYGTLVLMRKELYYRITYTDRDIPRNIHEYPSDIKPRCQMIGRTKQFEGREFRGREGSLLKTLYQLLPALKAQDIIYVLSEVNRGKTRPRFIGHMNVTALNKSHGTLTGAVHLDQMYMTSRNCRGLSEEETDSLRRSSGSWESYYSQTKDVWEIIQT
jgi:hypothetical protein